MTAINIKNVLDNLTDDDDIVRTQFKLKSGETLHIMATKNEELLEKILTRGYHAEPALDSETIEKVEDNEKE